MFNFNPLVILKTRLINKPKIKPKMNPKIPKITGQIIIITKKGKVSIELVGKLEPKLKKNLIIKDEKIPKNKPKDIPSKALLIAKEKTEILFNLIESFSPMLQVY